VPDKSSSERSTNLDPTCEQPDRPRPQLPNHELIRCIGRGAFGEVWLARNIMGTYRAVKIVYRRSFSDERPYVREFRGLQKFEPISRSHDGFVDILDTGLNAADGYFFYVMELADDVVSGNKIDPDFYEPNALDKETAKRRCVPVQTCVTIGVSLSAALSHLHQHGLLHRDIKPSNIIFVNGIPKIADIGLVTRVEGTQTFPGGTEGYFPRNEGPGTVQADIYALGKVLYELSTGQDRFDFPSLPTRLDDKQDPDQFRELNQVILRACEEDPQKRYRQAEDLHADLLLLMAGKSVQRIRALEKRVARLIQIGLVTALILLVAGAALFGWNRHIRQVAEQRRQQVGRNVAYGNNLVDAGDFFGALPSFWEALRLEQDVPQGLKNNRLRIGSLLEQCPRITKLWVLSEQHLVAADLTRDGRYVITADLDGTTTLCDLTQGSPSQPWPKEEHTWLEAVSFSPDGRYAAIAGPGFVKVWEMATHTLVSTASPPETVYNVKFTRDGSRFVTASGSDNVGYVYLYDTRSPGHGTELAKGPAAYRCIALNTNETRLVMAAENGLAQVWDLATSRPIGAPISHNLGTRETWLFWAAFSPDGQRVVTVGENGTVQVCEAETGRRILLLRYPAGVKSAEFSPDGRYIVTACWDYTARIADASTGELIYPTLKQSGKFLMYASFSPNGRQVLTVNANGIICLWDLATPMRRSQGESLMQASQDGHRLCTIQSTNIDVFDPANPAHASKIVADALREVIFNKDGSRLVTLSEKLLSTNRTTVAQLWDTERGAALSAAFGTDSSPSKAILSDDGRRLVTWRTNLATVWDALGGRRLYSLKHADKVSDKGGCFSPDGTWLATISATNVYIWNAVDGTLKWVLPHVDSIEHVAFSPDSRLLVTCVGSPGTYIERDAQIWDVTSGTLIGRPLHHSDGVKYAEFSHDGKRVVTSSEDATVRVWEVPSGRLLSPPLLHSSTVTEARFSLDDGWIVTVCEGAGTARVWDAQTGEPLTPPLKHPWHVTHVQFVDDSRKILTRRLREQGGTPTLWELPSETRSLKELARLAKVLSGHELDLTGAVLPQTPDDLQKTWEGLLPNRPKEFTVSPEDIINWHVREAEGSEKEKQWSAAVFHWNYVVQARPDNQAYLDRLNHARDSLNTTNGFPNP
jgi:WD40 repeat protein